MDDFTFLEQRVFPLLILASREIARLTSIESTGAQSEAAHYRRRCWHIAKNLRTVYARPLSSEEHRQLVQLCDLLAGELPPALTPSKG